MYPKLTALPPARSHFRFNDLRKSGYTPSSSAPSIRHSSAFRAPGTLASNDSQYVSVLIVSATGGVSFLAPTIKPSAVVSMIVRWVMTVLAICGRSDEKPRIRLGQAE
jgi:hypothetical protein